jgi:DNA modification methylase
MLGGKVQLLPGDCREVLATLPDVSVDAIVCDPPYGLGFMGRAWDAPDGAPFAVELWQHALRVLRPGGHLVAFSGTRTYHRMARAIEDAGFEIRDQLAWVYGSGFPKSLDVGKAIDKRRVEDLEPIRAVCRLIRVAMEAAGLKSRHLVEHFDNCHPRLIDHWAARDTDSQPSLPTWEQWLKLKQVLGLGDGLDDEVWRLNGRKGKPGDAWESREVTGTVEEWTDRTNYAMTTRDGLRRDVPTTDAARQWQGWGTALKPSWEPICLARRPLIGTVAANVLAHGTGALNIDGCRVEATDKEPLKKSFNPEARHEGYVRPWMDGRPLEVKNDGLGRWPANLLHDGSEEVVGLFPDADGAVSNGRKGVQGIFEDGIGSAAQAPSFGDSGSAARFFYTSKADAEDRLGSSHPTVKPVDLMQWLCRLVCPKGGVVLDPFAGTGTTGEAAWREGMRAILIEREPEYQQDIARRMDLATQPTKRAAVAATKNKLDDPNTLPLFAGAAE